VKKVIITGGRGDIGSACAELFRKNGHFVTQIGRRDLDILNQTTVTDYFLHHPCDTLICAAGMIDDHPLIKMDEESWDSVYHGNFTTAQYSSLAVLQSMINQGGGHIIFLSSYAALHSAYGQVAYASAKSALHGLMRELSSSYGSAGIRVNTILPGFLETKMTSVVSERRKDQIRELHSMKKFNTASCVAEFVYFLDERMEFTSGQIFQLDSRSL
jgi:3-oxoacyl-[acyl-carrier protein] reductase